MTERLTPERLAYIEQNDGKGNNYGLPKKHIRELAAEVRAAWKERDDARDELSELRDTIDPDRPTNYADVDEDETGTEYHTDNRRGASLSEDNDP
jgi:hypothetical protein